MTDHKRSKDWIPALVLIAAIFVVVGACYLFLDSLGRFCGNKPLAEKPASYELSLQSSGGESRTASPTYMSRVSPSLVPGYAQQIHGSAKPEHEAVNDPDAWRGHFWCEVNGSDFFIALFTLALVIATGFLWWATHRLWKSGEAQIEITRREFQAAHRPEFVVREVFWTKIVPDNVDAVSFTLINRGQGRGCVVESALEVRSDNPIVQFTADGNNALGNTQLDPGEFVFRQVIAPPFLAGAKEMLEETFFRGIIIYEDGDGKRRRLVICRRCAKGHERFVPLKDPDYEYND